MSLTTKAVIYTGVMSLLVGLAMLWLAPFHGQFAPATCTFTRCFCEFPRIGSAVLQPANSWSSFGFVFVGFLLFFEARSKVRLSAFSGYVAITYAIGAISVGIGSALLHGTLTLWGQFADVVGMYLLSGFSLVYAVAKIFDMKRRDAAISYILLCSVLILVLILAPEVRRWLFLVVLVVALILEIGFARRKREGVALHVLLWALLAQAVAFGIWTLDQQRLICVPDSLLQGHAIWHLLCAVSLYLTSRYYLGERQTS